MNPKNESSRVESVEEVVQNPAGEIEIQDADLDEIAGGAAAGSSGSCCPGTGSSGSCCDELS